MGGSSESYNCGWEKALCNQSKQTSYININNVVLAKDEDVIQVMDHKK